MLKSVTSGRTDPLRLAVGLIVALTVWRLALLPASRMGLYVDEAQYWLWGQEMAFGAYSKPPMVGWLIRAANEVFASNAPWVARMPWPLVHGVAAMAVLGLGARLAGPCVGALAGLGYAVLPAVSLGSVLISTDSPMLMFFALGLWLWHRQAAGASPAGAVALGAAFGLAMLSKYSTLFVLAGLALAAIISRDWRLRPRDAVIAAVAGLATFAPNIVWNLRNGMATVRHTAENADFQGFSLRPDLALRFLAEQFAVAGPVFFAVLLAAFWGWRRLPPGLRGLAAVAIMPLMICTLQALQGGANANWGVSAYVPGAILVAVILARRRALMIASFAINGALAVALPLVPPFAEDLKRPDGTPILARYYRPGDMPLMALNLARAQAQGPFLIVSDERALIAQLIYQAHLHDFPDATLRALPPKGRNPDSHYELLYPLTNEAGPAWLLTDHPGPACADEITREGRTILYSLDANCLDSLR